MEKRNLSDHDRGAVRFCRIFDEIGERLRDNMNVTDQRLGLRVAGLIFALVCLTHLIRIVDRAEIHIGTYTVPMWLSIVGTVVSGALCIWMWTLSSRGPRP